MALCSAGRFYSQVERFFAETEGRCPRKAFRCPRNCCRSHFGVIELTVASSLVNRKLRRRDPSPAGRAGRFDSPDFLAGARTYRNLSMEPLSAPKWEKWDFTVVAGHLHRINPPSSSHSEVGGSSLEHFTFLFSVLLEEDTTAGPILATG